MTSNPAVKTNRSRWAVFARLPLAVQLLLLTQMLFNVGFYLVVPFLATFMSQSLAASGTMIGLVLGLRTFSQQGLFFVGGALTDRFGVKPILLIGIAIRIIGFIAAGLSTTASQLLIAVVLIGFAAALFSPAAEASFSVAGRSTEDSGLITRAELFALDTVFSRVGALIGPILGAVLLPIGFPLMCFIAAGIFGMLLLSHALTVPAVTTPPSASIWNSLATVLRNKLFIAFAVAYSTGLVAYNQQYLSLPVELERATGSQEAIGWMFVFASIFVLLLQMPLARWAQQRTATVALAAGFISTASSFALIALLAPLTPADGWLSIAPILIMLMLLHIGQMVAVPIARDLVGIIAHEEHVGTYFGFLNSFGGLSVLISSLILGGLLDFAHTPQPTAALPWLVLTAIMAASAIALPRIATIARSRKVSI
ncbi:Major Facilitator Superfamily transporter [Corynebacterium mustelae]|uniref:Major Facilitator Superfamily transporter n=1 Tax=Corynebacterium mustelae TaxID=571915 RepID=A0A0G3H543_9CORY|nr:MFS transporter [Corynebacterium mustelae]AKK06212.1 Major Facilitator Superfamily transporter [Corynebacterium mustelae]